MTKTPNYETDEDAWLQVVFDEGVGEDSKVPNLGLTQKVWNQYDDQEHVDSFKTSPRTLKSESRCGRYDESSEREMLVLGLEIPGFFMELVRKKQKLWGKFRTKPRLDLEVPEI